MNNSDAAVDFDGVDDSVEIGDPALISSTTRGERTIELWAEPDDTVGRQLIYEEGGSTNGTSIYLDGTTLYGYAWGSRQGGVACPSSPERLRWHDQRSGALQQSA